MGSESSVRKQWAAAVVIAILLPLFAFRPAAAATAAEANDEAAFLRDANGLRSQLGLPPLQLDAELTAVARRWSATMAAAGDIWHNPGLGSAVTESRWLKLNENVGTGPDEQSVHDAFVASPGHRSNLVNPSYTHIGVGVVRVGSVVFVTQTFMRSVAAEARPPGPSASTVAAPAVRSTAATRVAPPPTAPAPAVATARLRLTLDQLRSLGV